MHRRQFLRTTGSALAVAAGAGVASADGDADPRPEPVAGTVPNENVRTSVTGALPGEPDELPVGNWIRHANGWTGLGSVAELRSFANTTDQTYVIDGEAFVLDGFDDWELQPGGDLIQFEYVTPPKPKGETYEIRWEFDSGGAFPALEDIFPLSNAVEIVGRR